MIVILTIGIELPVMNGCSPRIIGSIPLEPDSGSRRNSHSNDAGHDHDRHGGTDHASMDTRFGEQPCDAHEQHRADDGCVVAAVDELVARHRSDMNTAESATLRRGGSSTIRASLMVRDAAPLDLSPAGSAPRDSIDTP